MAPVDDEVVIFDLDGVLADSHRSITSSLRRAFAAQGLAPRDEAELTALVGPPFHLGFADLLGVAPDSETVVALIARYRDDYRATYLEQTPTFPGTPEVLATLARSRRLGVATSKPLAFAEPLIVALGLRDFFDVVCGPAADAIGETKSVTVARALCGLGATRGAMVGDRLYDMLAAREHGLLAVGVTSGIGTAAELTAAGADVLVDEPHQLLALLERAS